MGKKRYSTSPSAADEVAKWMRKRGIDLDALRLEEGLAAQRSREKAEFSAYRSSVEAAALAARKARRATEVAGLLGG